MAGGLGYYQVLGDSYGSTSGTTTATSDTSYTWKHWIQAAGTSSTSSNVWTSWTTSTEATYGGIIYDSASDVTARAYGLDLARQADAEIQRAIMGQAQQYNQFTQGLYGVWTSEPQRVYSNLGPKEAQEIHSWYDPIQTLYRRNQTEINRQWNQMLADELREEKRIAEVTAQDMLLDIIGEDEFKAWLETGHLLIHGRKFDYLIRRGASPMKLAKGKIVQLGKRRAGTMCVHLRETFKYPETDNVIALAMAMKFDEENFLKIANHHGMHHVAPIIDKAANF